MTLKIADSWKNILQEEFQKPYFNALSNFVKSEYRNHICYPHENDIFSAFNFCAFEDVKVVIIGQDPYHDKNQANGLCFSVKDGVKPPPSLVNIFKEIQTDIAPDTSPITNLERWASQGVLLLNATLTVRAHEAGSHQKQGWETFTDQVIKQLSDQKEDIIFLLWGGYAKKKAKLIDNKKHHILVSGHPSPLSANRGYWFGNEHFSKTNTILERINKSKILW
ncbi:MAG: uracil-DNA glycosylase [Polaribacter sp.]|nr:uracil-DNA glycosylase [Polaribacter sp.]MDG1452251.1 uracil-DNA glycosylase [Polaribacter sp.]